MSSTEGGDRSAAHVEVSAQTFFDSLRNTIDPHATQKLGATRVLSLIDTYLEGLMQKDETNPAELGLLGDEAAAPRDTWRELREFCASFSKGTVTLSRPQQLKRYAELVLAFLNDVNFTAAQIREAVKIVYMTTPQSDLWEYFNDAAHENEEIMRQGWEDLASEAKMDNSKR